MFFAPHGAGQMPNNQQLTVSVSITLGQPCIFVCSVASASFINAIPHTKLHKSEVGPDVIHKVDKLYALFAFSCSC